MAVASWTGLFDALFVFFLVTVADYANSDPAVVKSGRVKKAVANAVQQEGELGPERPAVSSWAELLLE